MKNSRLHVIVYNNVRWENGKIFFYFKNNLDMRGIQAAE